MQMKTHWLLLFFYDFTEVEYANIYFNAFSAIQSLQSLLESSLEAIESPRLKYSSSTANEHIQYK